MPNSMLTQHWLQSPKVLHKYVALYAAELIREDKIMNALDLYVKYGAPAMQQVYFMLLLMSLCPKYHLWYLLQTQNIECYCIILKNLGVQITSA